MTGSTYRVILREFTSVSFFAFRGTLSVMWTASATDGPFHLATTGLNAQHKGRNDRCLAGTPVTAGCAKARCVVISRPKKCRKELIPSVEREDEVQGGSDAEAAKLTMPPVSRLHLQTDGSHIVVCYANFARVTGTPEELILDSGLNSHPMAVPNEPLAIDQRIIVNHFTPKRLLAALRMPLQGQDAAFGVMETNAQKRGTPASRRAMRSDG